VKTFWLSYAPPPPERGRVMLVDAATPALAHLKATVLGMSREGDQVLILEIPPDTREYQLPRDRELTEAEIRGVGALPLDEAREQGLKPVWEEETE
jgi:hypothetical protein